MALTHTSRSWGEFSRRMSFRGEQVEVGVNRIKRDVAIAVHYDVARNTPVDTGQARSNWVARLNRSFALTYKPYAPGRHLGRGERSNLAQAVAQAVGVIETAKPGDAIHFTNNLPYISRLNDGHSRQSPSGFVQRAIKSGIRGALKYNRLLK